MADDKKLSLYEVRSPHNLSHLPTLSCIRVLLTLLWNFLQGAYHEIQNEPDGVKEKMAEECITWIEARLSGASSAPATAGTSEAATPVSKL